VEVLDEELGLGGPLRAFIDFGRGAID